MDILFFSNSGECLPIAWRLMQEGLDVGVYIHSPQYRKNYDGMLPKVSVRSLKTVLKTTDTVIFDTTRANERTKQDIILLKTFGLTSASPGVFGPVADKLKNDHRVIGSSTITEELELDKGIKLAEEMGFAIPEFHKFKDLSEGIKFLTKTKNQWVFKSNIEFTYVESFAGELLARMLEKKVTECEHILQEKIDGVEVSTEVWIGKQGPKNLNQTIESKRLMAGNLGPAIGSQSNTVYMKKTDDLISKALLKMADYLHKEDYVGPCSVNVIVRDGVPYFLEWTPRFGYDALYCLLTLLKGTISEFLLSDFDGEFHKGYACSQRISIPPYPYASPSLLTTFAKDVPVESKLMPFFWAQDIYTDAGKIKCAGADGIVGVVTARDERLEAAWSKVYSAIGKLKIAAYLQYRNGSYSEHKKRCKKLGKSVV